RTPVVSGQVTNSLAVCALYIALAIVMKLAFKLGSTPTEEKPGKTTMETEAESMVTVPIYQASTSVPPLSTPIIDLSPPILVSSPLQEPVITTTRPLLPPSQQHNTIDSSELPEADMKEILHQWMFKSGSYKSLPEHVALYEALEASMKHENRDEFLAEKEKSRKRRRDDQDRPQPPPHGSDQSKKPRHDSDASGSKQPLAQMSSAWKSFDTKDILLALQSKRLLLNMKNLSKTFQHLMTYISQIQRTRILPIFQSLSPD
nr:hypothetical protein [Tanacetum cinerariifolium]